MTHTDPKPLGGEQYSTPGTSLPATNSPVSDERLTQTPEVVAEQNEPGNPGQAVVIQGAPVVPEGAMTLQRAPGSEDGQEGDARALPVIAVRELTKVYILGGKTRVPALQGVSLEVYPGEFVAIMGPSGSGKSTFMNLVGCLDRPTQGEYWLAGNLVSRLSNDKLASVRNRLVGFVFQGFNLLGRATALRNVALPMVYAGLSRRERERRARIVLQLVGLGDRVHHKPAELSGGQQQRVAIARALINGPALLLADEPTGNLDSHTSVEIMGVLQALNEQGLTIVLVTHDPNIAQYARRRVTFLDGRVVRDEPVLNPRSALEEWNALMNPPAIEGEGAVKEVSS
jgi:putative ABC transport system ATP-binding protein